MILPGSEGQHREPIGEIKFIPAPQGLTKRELFSLVIYHGSTSGPAFVEAAKAVSLRGTSATEFRGEIMDQAIRSADELLGKLEKGGADG